MPEITRYLRVFPAPYLCFDHVGRPAGAFPHEPKFDGGAPADDAVHHVGASRGVGRLLRKAAGNLTAHHEHLFHFGAQPEGAPASEVPVDKSRGPGDPILVENSEYYRKAVKTHQLYAADLETWETAGGDPSLFIDPHLKQLHAITTASPLPTWPRTGRTTTRPPARSTSPARRPRRRPPPSTATSRSTLTTTR